MSNFTVKMRGKNPISAGAPPKTPPWELTVLLLAGFRVPTSKGKGSCEGRDEKGIRGWKGKN